jgi:bla regulator protein BlaR1
MHDHWTMLSAVFMQVVKSSIYSASTIGVIFLAQWVGRRWIPPKWSYALWFILLVRMALPFGPESMLSLWNYLPSKIYQIKFSSLYPQNAPSSSDYNFPSLHREGRVKANTKQFSEHSQKSGTETASEQSITWYLLPVLWSGGALLLFGIITANNLHLWNSIRRLRLATEQSLVELLEDCKQLAKVQTIVGLVITDRVKSPSLFGFIRPRILIPTDMSKYIARDEMRFILLHELAHLKRGDIWIGWIVGILLSLHWFNPLVWWAFFRMRADRELACDAQVLSYLGNKDSHQYGSALIKLLENFSQPQRLPAVAGILENKTQLKRRIKMIAQFRSQTRSIGIASATLLAMLSVLLLTDAKNQPSLLQAQDSANSSIPAPRSIKVGGGIQQSKLIFKVDPVYPEAAKASGLFGKIKLEVTINEEGMVSDAKAVEGHPILCEAAISAVRQWRYSTTLLNGMPVAVNTNVTMTFSADKQVNTAYIKDPPAPEKGFGIWPILIPPNLSDPNAQAHIRFMAEPMIKYADRSYYTVVSGISAPQLAIDKARLRRLADTLRPQSGAEAVAPLYYFVFVNEDGTIAGIRRGQGAKIAEIENELINTHVLAPARFGKDAVASWISVEIDFL